MTKEEIAGIVRALVAAGVAVAVSKGWLVGDDVTIEALTVGLSTLGVAIWSVKAKRS